MLKPTRNSRGTDSAEQISIRPTAVEGDASKLSTRLARLTASQFSTLNPQLVWRAFIFGLFLAAIAANAQPREKAYLTVDAGVNLLQSVDFQSNRSLVDNSIEAEFDPGFRFDAGLGYVINDGGAFSYHFGRLAFDIAAELDAGLAYNEAYRLGSIDLDQSGSSLSMYQIPLLANFVFRVPIGERFGVSVGGGAGGLVAILQSEGRGAGNDSEAKLLFAYQAIANLHYRISEHVSTSIGYKFLATSNTNFEGEFQVRSHGLNNHWLGLAVNWVF